MTQTIAENANRDLYVGADGNIAFASGVQAVEQLCKSRIEAQRAEMQYAMDQGMPMRATAFDRYRPAQFEAAARAILKATPDVLAVTAFTITSIGNVLSYSATIETIYGTGTVAS